MGWDMTTKKKNIVKKLTLINPKKKSITQKDFIDDAIHLMETSNDYGDIKGYAIVAIYKDAVNCNYLIPEHVPEHLFPLLTADIIKDYIKENRD